MKRKNNLYKQIYSMENLELADKKASSGKSMQYGVIVHNQNREQNLRSLQETLINRRFRTSSYKTFTIFEPKERTIFCLPYYPDRILHHAIMNVVKPVLVNCFTRDTYSCIEGRGIHAAANAVKCALNDTMNTVYCLKLDIRKFYPNIDHDILKDLLRRKFKDNDLLALLDEIIDSADGVPIGNYLSQYFANFYLTYFDHWLKETKHVKYYFRYADDIFVLHGSKEYLHKLLSDMEEYLSVNLKLAVKDNYQVFPVEARGIDFVGYRFYHTHTLLRKRIKQNFARMLKRNWNIQSVASYYGWVKHCNSRNLLKKLLNVKSFSEFKIEPSAKSFVGDKIKIDRLVNKSVVVEHYIIEPSNYQDKGNGKRLKLQITYEDEKRIVFSGSGVLMDLIQQVPEEGFPFTTIITKTDRRYDFT